LRLQFGRSFSDKISRMPLTKVEQDICLFSVQRLLEQGDVTRKQALLKKFRGSLSDALRKLVDRAVFRAVEQVYNQETYLPRAIAFHYCGDANALALAKTSTEAVLQVLLSLYEQELDREPQQQKEFTPSDVELEARNLKLDVDQNMVRLGLYFADELTVFWSAKKDAQQVFLLSFRVGEHIYEVTKLGSPWDLLIERGRTNVENHPFGRSLERIDISGQPQNIADLPNKEKLISDVSSFLTRKSGIALLVIDLDHFKHVNDTKGHLEGDACLNRVVKAIGGVLGRKGILYRWGGDEFAVSLPDFSTDEAHATAERIRRTVEEAKPGGDDLPVTTSIGVGGSDRMSSRSAEDLIAVADKAMYRSKHQGKNRVTSWSAAEFEKEDAKPKAMPRPRTTAATRTDHTVTINLSKLAKVRIEPIVPREHEQSEFMLMEESDECFTFQKIDSQRSVDIPKSFIEKIHKYGDSRPALIQLSGRLQWISNKRNFDLFPEKPPAGSAGMYGIGKEVDNSYPVRLGVQGKFGREDRLPEILGRGGTIFYDSDGMYLRWSGRVFVVA
jgi:diguanylate cyclase (GGDEF)-like protein